MGVCAAVTAELAGVGDAPGNVLGSEGSWKYDPRPKEAVSTMIMSSDTYINMGITHIVFVRCSRSYPTRAPFLEFLA